MAIKEKHVHKLKRHTYKSGNQSFFCCLPDCSYKISPALALGKRSLCWRCGADFILTDYSLRLAKPHCEACHRPKGVNGHEEIIVPEMSEEQSKLTGSVIMPSIHKELSLSERLELALKQKTNATEEDI